MIQKIKVLWVDDEIEFLKPHVMFLENKGYEVITMNNGEDALQLINNQEIDIVFIDENMPGLTGIDTIEQINDGNTIPIVMVTKSEEESIMDMAIGSKISDYLIKPVNPMQILMSLKKHFDSNRLIKEKSNSDYQKEFGKISMDISMARSYEDWVNIYTNLIQWEMKLENIDSSMYEVLDVQKKEANNQFFRFIKNNYEDWFDYPEEAPALSHTVLKRYLMPQLNDKDKTCLIVIDNLRYDQLLAIKPMLAELFNKQKEEFFFSILPTTTQYARNALFSGLMPSEIEKVYPDKWVPDHVDGNKNDYEDFFLEKQIQKWGFTDNFMFEKVFRKSYGEMLVNEFRDWSKNSFNCLVFNFVDILSHAKTNIDLIKELSSTDKAYRDLTVTWFKNSSLYQVLKLLSESNIQVILTTDHGMINIAEPIKIVGDKETNTNLRYKTGKNLSLPDKQIYRVNNPKNIYLPQSNLSSSYVFGKPYTYFAYPNNYKKYVNYYKDTYQHGGISLEEMICPFVTLSND
jgi:DNA-binding response OmpR family regulator